MAPSPEGKKKLTTTLLVYDIWRGWHSAGPTPLRNHGLVLKYVVVMSLVASVSASILTSIT
jgi:hypothetical protein